jgi:hypothetical protein
VGQLDVDEVIRFNRHIFPSSDLSNHVATDHYNVFNLATVSGPNSRNS